MTTLGLLQYLAPVLQFGFGITLLGEEMPPARWIGFGLVWREAKQARHQRLGHRGVWRVGKWLWASAQ